LDKNKKRGKKTIFGQKQETKATTLDKNKEQGREKTQDRNKIR
jgi:hypothetical protein